MIESGDGWFVADNNGLARGPLSRAELQALRDNGKIGDDHLVWTLRQAEWVPLRRALGLAQTVATGGAGGRAAVVPSRPAAPAAKPPSTPAPNQSQPRQSDADWRKQLGRDEPVAAKLLLKDAGAIDLQQRGGRAREGLRRFLSRNIDLALLGGFGWALLSAIGLSAGLWVLDSPQAELQSGLLGTVILLVVAALPLEALLLGLSGYTPGRLLLGLRVVDAKGDAPGIGVAFNRSTRVALMGQALMVPPFSIFAYAVAFGTLVSKGRTHWDESLSLKVRTAALTADRWWLAIAATGIAWALLFEGVWMRVMYQILAQSN